MSTTVDDEALSAFLDGELPADRRAQVARALAASPAVAERLAALAALHADLRTLFDPVLTEPVPERLRALLDAGPGAAAPAVVPFRRRLVAAWQPAALAASLALLLGVGAGWGLRAPPPEPRLAGLAPTASAALQAILERAPSGETRPLGPDGEVTPVASLADAEHGWCRLFVVDDGTRPLEAVACRDGGGWRVLALAELSTAPAAAADGYAPATGGSPSPLRSLLGELGLGEPVESSVEERLIREGWPGH